MCVGGEKQRLSEGPFCDYIMREREEKRQDNRSFGLLLFRPNGKSQTCVWVLQVKMWQSWEYIVLIMLRLTFP